VALPFWLVLFIFLSIDFKSAVFGAPVPRPRLVLIKVDGLSSLVVDGAVDPRSESVNRLPHPELFREAHAQLLSVLKRDVLTPNIATYFYRNGVRTSMYCSTLALSTPSWAMIDTGYSSIVKTNTYFNRFTGDLSSYLDHLRESLNVTVQGARRTTALWQLDLLEIPILEDHFQTGRTWTSIQPFYRERPTDQLTALAKYLITGGERSKNPLRLIRRHLAQAAYGPDYPEKNDRALASLAARKILETDVEGQETHDFVSLIFSSIDHQFHVDPHYENILSWLARLDDWIGEILNAVEQSRRRDSTLVVLLSDHGLDFDPVYLNYSFPINRWLREPEFGSHTVLSPVVEDTEHALTVPVRGVDFTRVYESPHSAFGHEVPGGEKGFVTAFTDNTGNPRFDAHFRNSDINRLHLLLLEVLRCRKQPELLERIYPEFQAALESANKWLGTEIDNGLRAANGLEELARSWSADPDAVSRLKEESAAYRRTVSVLQRLSTIPNEQAQWLKWAGKHFRVSDYLPKRYLGPNNTIEQLRNYITGWKTPSNERWKGPVAYRTVDYTRLFTSVKATAPNSRGNLHPFRFFSVRLPLERLSGAVDRPLRQAIWLVFASAEAIILESTEGEILYQPLEAVEFLEQGIRLKPLADPARDPFGYQELAGRWMSRRTWANQSTERNEWQLAPVILTELFRDNFRFAPGFLKGRESERFAKEHHFLQQTPDFRVWTFRGWNVNSNSHTPGGSHGNFTQLDIKTLFALWGGDAFELRRGELLPGAYLTSDIAPTLLSILERVGGNVLVPGVRIDKAPELVPVTMPSSLMSQTEE